MKWFGSTLKETRYALLGKDDSTRRYAKKDPEILQKEATARIIITFLLLLGAFTLVFLDVSPDLGKVILGAIVGYWLK